VEEQEQLVQMQPQVLVVMVEQDHLLNAQHMLVVVAVLKEQEQMEVVVDQVVVDQDQNQLAQVLLYLKEYQEMQEQVEVVAELMLHQEHQVKQVVQVEVELLLQKN
jgi:hypothetical protein